MQRFSHLGFLIQAVSTLSAQWEAIQISALSLFLTDLLFLVYFLKLVSLFFLMKLHFLFCMYVGMHCLPPVFKVRGQFVKVTSVLVGPGN